MKPDGAMIIGEAMAVDESATNCMAVTATKVVSGGIGGGKDSKGFNDGNDGDGVSNTYGCNGKNNSNGREVDDGV